MIYRCLYTAVFYLLLPAVLLRLLYRSLKAPGYRQRWAERFGIFSALKAQTPVIWLHAVSVGETLAAIPLIKALQKQYPDVTLVVTTTTPTGSERVETLFAQAITEKKLVHVYAPYDIPLALNLFLRRTNPVLTIVMETEMWPNMIHACFEKNIPVLIANARLSAKSARGYARFSRLTKNMLAEIAVVAAQNQNDGDRFIALGLNQTKLVVTGSIKFDLDITDEIRKQAAGLRINWSNSDARLVVLAASTHPGEESVVLDAFHYCQKIIPDILLVLVPRHPERFNAVHLLCEQRGFRVQRRSQLVKMAVDQLEPDTTILLGDSMGELLAFYGACDVAFIGGSLVPVGGHNLIEPAAWGKAILSGRHLFNFSEIAALLTNKGAMIECTTKEDLQQNLLMLLQDAQKRKAMGVAGKEIAESNRGALIRLMTIIDKLKK